jgi:hypothetical protein
LLLPSLSISYAADTDIFPDCCNFDRLSGIALLTLIKITFCPHSSHYCFFIVMIRNGCAEREVSFNQIIRFIASIGHMEKINDFIIKSLKQHSFFIISFSRHIPSRLSFSGTAVSIAVKVSRIYKDATRIRFKYIKVTRAQALAS